MNTTVIAPSGRVLRHRTTELTTSRDDTKAKIVSIKLTKEDRLAENREYLRNPNMQAFLKAIAAAEGGDYDFKYGAIKGRRNDPWRFTDYSTHPGPGIGGKTTAAGMYQVNEATWREMGGNMGLSDFTPETQDLIAVEILRVIKAAESINQAISMPHWGRHRVGGQRFPKVRVNRDSTRSSLPYRLNHSRQTTKSSEVRQMFNKRYLALCLALLSLTAHAAPLALQKGMSYVSARKLLLKEDWKPLDVHAQNAYVPMGVEHELLRRNYKEFDSCSIDNSSCIMRYKRGNECLSVFTIGEKIKYMKIVDWSDECAELRTHAPAPVAK